MAFFKRAACFTDIHFGLKGNSRVHNDDGEAFCYWFIEQAKAHGISEDEVVSKIMLQKHAIKEFVTPETLGKLALFLASEEASTMTGTALPVDGGWTAQ